MLVILIDNMRKRGGTGELGGVEGGKASVGMSCMREIKNFKKDLIYSIDL